MVFPLHEDPITAGRLQYNQGIRFYLPRPHTKKLVISGSFTMEWGGEEWSQLVQAWSCNPVSARWKPRSEFGIQSGIWVRTGIVRILYACSIYISPWLNIDLHAGHHQLFAHIQRCFLTRASWQKCIHQSQCPGNVTHEQVIGWGGHKCWHLDTVQESVRNWLMASLYQPWDRCFHGVGWRLQPSEDLPDVSLGRTDSFPWSLATVFCRNTWTRT